MESVVEEEQKQQKMANSTPEPPKHLIGVDSVVKLGQMQDANFPTDSDGRVYHVGVKRGEVANRILSVGDPQRAKTIAQLLDNPPKTFVLGSKRGFVTYTGLFNKVPVSIIATGMGIPMIDFVVRECRAVVDGTMAIIRFGTCGTVQENTQIGSIAVASMGSRIITRNPDGFDPDAKNEPHYRVSKSIKPDAELSQLLVESLKSNLTGDTPVVEGENFTADSFYSSQGRTTLLFDDQNTTLIQDLVEKFPNASTLEMETGHLFDLSRCSHGTIKSSAATIVLAQRRSNKFLDLDTLHRLEKEGGKAVLTALTSYKIHEKDLMDESSCVWKHQ